MTAVDMARKRAAFRLDERILGALEEAAKASGRSRNAWLEYHLFNLFKSTGHLTEETEPLGETRGGLRSQSKEEATDDEK